MSQVHREAIPFPWLPLFITFGLALIALGVGHYVYRVAVVWWSQFRSVRKHKHHKRSSSRKKSKKKSKSDDESIESSSDSD